MKKQLEPTTKNRTTDFKLMINRKHTVLDYLDNIIVPGSVFKNNSFHVGGFSGVLRKAGKISKSDTIRAWSICKVHEQLKKRYWPDPLIL